MASSDLNQLKIDIVADASTAVSELEKIGKKATEVKGKLGELNSQTSETSKSFGELSKILKDLAKTDVKDPFGLVEVNKRLAELNSSSKALQKSTRDTTDGLAKNIGKIETSLAGIQKSIKDCSFKADKGFEDQLNKMSAIISQSDQSRKLRGRAVAKEGALLREQRRFLRSQNTFIRKAGVNGSRAIGVGSSDISQAVRVAGHYGLGTVFSTEMRQGARRFYDEISHLQEKRARVNAWGLSNEEKTLWNYQVKDLLSKNKFITEADAESMMMAASSSIGHYDPNIVGKTVEKATKFAQMERALGYNKSEIDDIAKNYYGVAEARQVANDVAKTLETFETVFKITTTTSGKITVADVETILRNMGPGASTISDEGLLRLLAYAEQIKIAGRGSSGSTGAGISTVGTNVKMLQLMAMGKPSAINAKKQMAELGVMEDGSYIVVNDKLQLAQDTSNKENAKEQAIARGIFGQALEDVIINGKKLGMAGVWNKELAQADPVKWVESMTDLIKQYTASEENRAEYYGYLAKGSEKKSTEEFLASLTKDQIYSATQTFWAKTGLSQRVLTALTTFSNESFLHRSEAMMKTAQKQRTVDDLQRLEIQNGNLNLAFLQLEKATSRLIQTFEPLGRVVGRITFELAGFVDNVAQWTRNWNDLASLTLGIGAGYGVSSAVKHFGESWTSYSDLSSKNQRSDNFNPNKVRRSKLQENSDSLGFIGYINKIDEKVDKSVTGFKRKLGGLVASIGTIASRAFGAIGVALLAIDFGTMLYEWNKETEIFGVKVKTIFENLQEWFNTNPLVVSWKFGSGDNKALADLQNRFNDVQSRITELESSETLTADQWQELNKLKAEKEELGGKISTVRNESQNSYKRTYESVENIKNFFDKSGLNTIATDLKSLNESAKFNAEIVKKQSDLYSQGPIDMKGYEDVNKVLGGVIKNQYDSFEKLTKIFTSEELGKLFDELDKRLREEKDEDVAREIIEQYVQVLNSLLSKAGIDNNGLSSEEFFVKWQNNIELTGKQLTHMILSNNLIDETNRSAYNKANANIEEYKRKQEQAEQIKSGKKPNVYKEMKSDKLGNYVNALRDKQAKLSAPSVLRGNFETMAETEKRMQEELLSELASGKFKRKGEVTSPYQVEVADKGEALSPKHFDLSKRDAVTGLTGYEVAHLKALDEQLKNWGENFRNMMKSAETAVISSNYELEEATNSITEIGEASKQSTAFRNLKRDIEKLRHELEESPVSDRMKEQIAQVMSLRGDQALNIARKDAYDKMKSYDRGLTGFYESSLTSRGQKYASFNRETSTLNAEHKARVQELEEAKTLAVVGKSLEEKQRIVEEANAEIEALNMRHHEYMLAREEAFNKEMNEKAKLALQEKIEAWQDVDAHVTNFQSELMEGFVKANEDWLDGDLNSWRDYANNLLKILRNMFLKIGYSKLLGGAAEGISGFLKDFTVSAFGLENKGGDPASLGSKVGGGLFGWIHGLTGGGVGSGTPMIMNQQTSALQPNMNGFGLNVQNGQPGYNMLSTTTAGVGSAVGSGIASSAGAIDTSVIDSQFNQLASTVTGLSDSMTVGSTATQALNTSTMMLNSTELGINSTKMASQTIETISQGLEQASNSKETENIVTTTIFGKTLSSATGELFAFGAALAAQKVANVVPNANGGIMTSKGPLPLKTYANGGIARTAQVAIFGEGRQPEAYVPLPDGRTIPVTINGGGMGESGSVGGNNINISINVSNHNEGGSSENSSTEGDSSQQATNMKKLANNIKLMVKQEIYNQSRPGGLLYNSR